jgi:glucose/arabinose dehydrogenase
VAKGQGETPRLLGVWTALLAAILAAAVLVLLAPGSANAGTLPSGFQESTVFSGLDHPTALQFSRDGRIFVAEKNGRIKVFDDLADTTPTLFADLSTNVYNFWDRGLLGLALDPNFPTKPYVYVLYTYDHELGSPAPAPRWGTPGVLSDPCPTPPGPTGDGCVVSGRLSKLTASGNTMTGSEQVLIEDWCQQYPSHSIGALAFGADGALYVSGGDGASFNFVDYGQDGSPLNPCGDPPSPPGTALAPPTAEGGALRSQDLRTSGDPVSLDGAILRVNPETGEGLPDNPLATSSDENARRIIAHGLRNPFRITIRPGTNEVWAGDVGWNDWEEIDRVADPRGPVENFGWPCYEGLQRQSGYDNANLTICENLYGQVGAVTDPYFKYHHSERVVPNESCPTGGSSTAGIAFEFYQGGPYPSDFDGALFFADYSRDCIWVMKKGADNLPAPGLKQTFVGGAANPVDLQVSPAGELYYVDFDGGTIRRIQHFPATSCAQGSFRAEYFNNTTLSGAPTTERCENAINNDWGTSAPQGTGVGPDNFSVRWTGTFDFEAGDYTFSTTADDGVRMWVDGQLIIDQWRDQGATTYQATRTLTAGPHEVKVEYYENGGDAVAKASWEKPATGGNTAPTATINTPPSTTAWSVGDVITFSGSATDQQDGTLSASRLSWDLILHHCPLNCHTHPLQSFSGVAGGSFTAPDHEYPSHLELKLTATDSGGLTDTESLRLDPRTVALTFNTSPGGLQLTVNGRSAPTSFSRTVIVGSSNSISANTPQTKGKKTYTFLSWSDGGPQSHNITAPATATTYTARYR